jgi:hypothetical protein
MSMTPRYQIVLGHQQCTEIDVLKDNEKRFLLNTSPTTNSDVLWRVDLTPSNTVANMVSNELPGPADFPMMLLGDYGMGARLIQREGWLLEASSEHQSNFTERKVTFQLTWRGCVIVPYPDVFQQLVINA